MSETTNQEEDMKNRKIDTHPLHLVSWNVAGWRTTVEELARTTRTSAGRDGAADAQRCVGAWLERLAADIVCLQEVKVRRNDVENGSRRLCAAADDGSWETFWACNEGAGGQRSGLNGVATLVRGDAYRVRRACARPLGEDDLDAEGRCLLTDHGAFVVFNVYAPNASGGARLAFKLRFMRRLREAMAREVAAGRDVILAGDLNAKASRRDYHWSMRGVDCSRLGAAAADGRLDGASRAALAGAAEKWPAVRDALRRRTVVPVETTNPATRETHAKYRCRAEQIYEPHKVVQLGGYEPSALDASAAFEVDGVGVDGGGALVLGGDGAPAFSWRRRDRLGFDAAADAFEKLGGLPAARAALRKAVELGLVSDPEPDPARGGTTPASATAWLRGLVDSDAFVDSLDACHPDRANRYTCWNQYTNRRYANEGTRIDYILCSAGLWERGSPVAGTLDAGASGADASGADAALRATVLDGRWQPAAFAGGGLRDGRAEDYAHHSAAPPHTGIRYTPPSWSDHVAVTLALAAVPAHPPLAGKRDVGDAQPHARVKKITSFFKPRAAGAASGGAAAAPKPKRAAPKGIRAFFPKKPRAD